jgi:hypothetical protein
MTPSPIVFLVVSLQVLARQGNWNGVAIRERVPVEASFLPLLNAVGLSGACALYAVTEAMSLPLRGQLTVRQKARR